MSIPKDKVFHTTVSSLEDAFLNSSVFFDIFDAIKHGDYDAFIRLLVPAIRAYISIYRDDSRLTLLHYAGIPLPII